MCYFSGELIALSMYSRLSGKEISYKSLVKNNDGVIRYHLYTIHYSPATANIVWILFYSR